MDKIIKIAIVDDHELFREGLKLVLKQIPNFEVIIDKGDGHSFINSLEQLNPDIVLMDINMPVISGIETSKLALSQKPHLKIIALSMHSGQNYYLQMIQSGAKGFILKKSGKYELETAINEVYKGGSYFSPEILQNITYHIISPEKNVYSSLTKREKEVLMLVCKGLTSNEIADAIHISPKTVEVHRSNIFSKTGVRNTAELIIWAIKNDVLIIDQ
jgi:DNA-binding NarL/FixJ family response regulator